MCCRILSDGGGRGADSASADDASADGASITTGFPCVSICLTAWPASLTGSSNGGPASDQIALIGIALAALGAIFLLRKSQPVIG